MSTPQYQSYGSTRSNSSAVSKLGGEVGVFKKPLDPDILDRIRKRKIKVLDEDDYVEKVEKIIERDFFPELDKLKAQNEYIEAKEKNDVITMNRLQEKYSGCRPNTDSKRLASPATFETPVDAPRENDPKRGGGLNDLNEFDTPSDNVSEASATKEDSNKDEPVNLDTFLANHTSEDNESYHQIQNDAEKLHRIKNAWMYKDEAFYLENKANQMNLPSIEQQCELPIKPLEVETWTYQNINSVFHNVDSLPLTHEEKMSLSKKTKIIVHDNTRVTKTPWKTEKQIEALRRESEKQKEIAAGKVGIDGKELVRPETPSVNGFKLFSMAPSPSLSATDSPLMTWGEVESTPYRLEGCATPLPHNSGGPAFHIREVPKRDRIGKELADKNSKYYRESKMRAIEQVKSSMKSGRMKTGLAGMSPAAQRLASSKLGIRLGTDDMLRSSYTPSPRRGSSTPTPRSTPARATPTQKKQKTPTLGIRTAGGGGGGGEEENSLGDAAKDIPEPAQISTDNLLNLGQAKPRQRAKDFFMKPME